LALGEVQHVDRERGTYAAHVEVLSEPHVDLIDPLTVNRSRQKQVHLALRRGEQGGQSRAVAFGHRRRRRASEEQHVRP
jgi:hypothetical protein